MFTQCRGCGEIFKITVDELVTASAMVRCSSCGTVFNALDTLSEYKLQHTNDLILHENDNPPPLLTHEFKKSIIKDSAEIKASLSSNESEEVDFPKQEDNTSVLNMKPEFVKDEETIVKKKPVFLLSLLMLVSLGGLLWQSVMALENGSLQLPQGALRDKVCEYVHCYTETQNTDLDKIVLVSRSIRQHPGRDNSLIITSGIMNNSDQTQSFPALQVKMSNLDGDTVAMRRFLPEEYLSESVSKSGMMPHVLVPVTLELQSPGKNAVTFEVGFSPTYGAQK